MHSTCSQFYFALELIAKGKWMNIDWNVYGKAKIKLFLKRIFVCLKITVIWNSNLLFFKLVRYFKSSAICLEHTYSYIHRGGEVPAATLERLAHVLSGAEILSPLSAALSKKSRFVGGRSESQTMLIWPHTSSCSINFSNFSNFARVKQSRCAFNIQSRNSEIAINVGSRVCVD